MALINLAVLTGNLGKPWCGINPLRGQNNVEAAAHMGCEPASLTGSILLSAGREVFERVWRVPVPEQAGLRLPEMMDAALAGRLKAPWASGTTSSSRIRTRSRPSARWPGSTCSSCRISSQ
jgi:formate dehydrogenase major subunit